MSDTSSALADWAQLYNHGLGPSPPTASAVADSTLVTSAAAATSSSPSIEGRVGKSARRRSRASRRAPVTLLNTDTTNFRAMVQQFTGISSGSYSSRNLSNGPVINFGLGYGEQFNQGGGMVMPVDHLQQHQYHRQSYQPQHHHQQHHQYHYDESMFAAAGGGGAEGGNHNTTTTTTTSNNNNSNNVFVHGFSNSSTNLEMSDGLILDGVSSRMMPKLSSTNNRVDGYFT